MRRCPRCGGENRIPIAPGFWECHSIVTETGTGVGPIPGTPPHLGLMGPVPVEVERVCMHRYQEGVTSGGAMEFCECGTMAIGRCANDGRPVCGEPRHSALRADRRLCRACVDEFDKNQTLLREEAARASNHDETIAAVRRRFPASLAHPQPVVRAVVLIAATVDPSIFPNYPGQGPRIRRIVDPGVEDAFVELADSVLTSRVGTGWDLSGPTKTWARIDSKAVVDQLRDAGALANPRELGVGVYKAGAWSGMPKFKRRGSAAGWMVDAGYVGSSGDRYSSGTPGTPRRWLLADGRVASCFHYADTVTSEAIAAANTRPASASDLVVAAELH